MKKLFQHFLKYILLLFNKENINVAFFSKIDNRTLLEGGNKIGRNVGLYNSSIGYGTFMGNGCEFSDTNIGKYCSISRNVKVIRGRHPASVFVSTHPAFFSTLNQGGFHFASKTVFEENVTLQSGYSINIGNDVWLGYDARIMEGVTIGNGAIVGACSLVTKDVPPYAIVGGIPARIIRYRFDEQTIVMLEQIKWWNWSFSDLKKNADTFHNISRFISKFAINKKND